jgi:hypothetical protein
MASRAAGSGQELWESLLRPFTHGSERLHEGIYRRLVADLYGTPAAHRHLTARRLEGPGHHA